MTKVFFLFTALLIALSLIKPANSQSTYNNLSTKSLSLPSETGSRALTIDGSNKVKSSSVTETELGYLSGSTSSIQSQLNSKVNQTGGSLISPLRLDPKKDTKANLTTYAATAQNGEFVFATDEKKQYQVVDGVLKQIAGGGGGSAGENLLTNASFEDGVASPWTLTAGTIAQESTQVIHLEKSAKVTLSSQSLDFYQSSTLKASQFSGSEVQGLAYARIKTTVSGVKLCPRRAGAVVTSLCVDIPASGKWEYREIPFILGATSNGISINSNSVSVTGDIYIDDTFVGAQAVRLSGDASTIAGESYFAGTASCLWNRTSTTIGAFTAASACPGPTIPQSFIGDWQTTDSDLPRQTINNLPAGKYKATFIFISSNNGPDVPRFTIFDGSSSCEPMGGAGSNVSNALNTISCVFNYQTSGNRSFEIYSGSGSGTTTINNAVISPRMSAKFILEKYSSSSTYTSTNANYGRTQYTPTFTGLGSTSSIDCGHTRDGQFLDLDCKWTSVSATGVEARISLPTVNGVALTPSISSIRVVGTGSLSVAGDQAISVLAEPSNNYITFGFQGSSGAGLTKVTGSGWIGTGTVTVSISARIPIVGWEQSNLIVGSFKEIPTTIGSSGVDIQSFTFGSGADCTSVCSTGTCSICGQTGLKVTSVTHTGTTGFYNINGLDRTKYRCNGTGASGIGFVSGYNDYAASTSSYIRFQTGAAGTTANTQGMVVNCIGIPQ